MPRLKNSFTVLLLALWLAATHHCGLEAAEILLDHAPVRDCCAADKACANDNCDLVENGSYHPANSAVTAPAPVALLLCLGWLATEPAASEVTGPTLSATTRPLDWVPVWSFVRRAAPSPRAPSSLV